MRPIWSAGLLPVLLLTLLAAGCTDSSESTPASPCTAGKTEDCLQGDGQPGEKLCINGQWSVCRAPFCEAGATRGCTTTCNTEGVATCGDDRSWSSCRPPVEICNGVDDNCDGQTDEGELSKSCLCGTTAGTSICIGGAWAPCSAGSADAPELCDGLDNNCNGQIDDGVERTCAADCGEGKQTCEFGEWGPCSAPEPVEEVCDGLDNDCDSRTDEDLEEITCGVGECVHSVPGCVDGEAGECDPKEGSRAEVCDRKDNDCDGETDEGATDCCEPPAMEACSTNTGECSVGTRSCGDDGLWEACSGALPGVEVCDGLDNDCDGRTDQGNPGGGGVCGTNTGECTAGLLTCTGGALVCVGEVAATVEICDGKDNDCDGQLDEGNPGAGVACGTDEGACTPGITVCEGGKLNCHGEIVAAEESCNGADDDCDGRIDNNLQGIGDTCGTDAGECTAGLLTCTDGAPVCRGEIAPVVEVCNGKDDDCDGSTDEGNPGGGAACGTDIGVCQAGILTCTGGTLVCNGAIASVPESCDGQDNDCDGTIDQGLGEDGYEANDTCALARNLDELGTVLENDGPTAIEAKLYSNDLTVDSDWYRVIATEASHLAWCGDDIFVPQCYWLTVELTGAAGADQDLCLSATNCNGDGGQGCSESLGSDEGLTFTWKGRYGFPDDKVVYMQVLGVNSCEPYQLQAEMFGSCPDANGLCPWEVP